MAVYILPTVAGLGSLGRWEEWGTEADTVGYATVCQTFWGPAMGIFFVIVAILAQCSIYNTYIASGSRGFFSLADDNLAPPILVKCDKKHGVPYISVLTVGIVNLVLCMLPFGFIIVLDVCLLIASYAMVYISAMILRKRIPEEEYKFKIPGGYGLLCFICIVPLCVVAFAYFINGSDYYLGGMIGILTGPILYAIWRKRYGGLTKKNAELYPTNAKTGLAIGDTRRLAFMFMLMTIMNVIACFFMPWYEAWGDPENGWESGDYFDGILENFDVNQIVGVIQIGIYILTAVCAVAMIVFYIVSKKVEPAKKR